MKRFQFGLDTVLQYKRQVLDGAQNEYAEAIQRVRQQERRLREAAEAYSHAWPHVAKRRRLIMSW